jgi:glycosyltransferase involved in cell wall biosynthesis
MGRKIVFGLDDDVWNWPEWRKDSCPTENRATAEILIEVADHIIASTPTLAQVMGRPEKTTVAPNLVEVDAYRLPQPPQDTDRIRILWSGAASHRADLDLIDGACCRIKEKYGEAVEFVCVGAGPDNLLRRHWNRGAKLIPWQDLSFYWDTLNHFKPHISLAPLVDCEFNRSKSNIRVIEAWAMNSAVIASPVGEYRVVESGVDGLYADSEDEWFGQLCRLIEDHSLRNRLATEGHRRCVQDWNWSSATAREKWADSIAAIEKLVGDGSGG